MKNIDLSGFTGSEKLYKDQLGAVITEGVKYFAEEGEAFWAVSDMIVICKIHKLVKDNPFVSIIVSASNEKAAITYENGNGVRLFKQEYDYTTLPNGVWKFYFTDNTLMVTGEY
jgi:hypothetical protein